jgi:hypothetical protein
VGVIRNKLGKSLLDDEELLTNLVAELQVSHDFLKSNVSKVAEAVNQGFWARGCDSKDRLRSHSFSALREVCGKGKDACCGAKRRALGGIVDAARVGRYLGRWGMAVGRLCGKR